MRPRTTSSVLATLAAALLLGACGSGGIGDIINGPSGNYQSQLKGIVRTVDTRSGDCRIELDSVSNSTYLNQRDQRDPYGGGYGNGNRATTSDRTAVRSRPGTSRKMPPAVSSCASGGTSSWSPRA